MMIFEHFPLFQIKLQVFTELFPNLFEITHSFGFFYIHLIFLEKHFFLKVRSNFPKTASHFPNFLAFGATVVAKHPGATVPLVD